MDIILKMLIVFILIIILLRVKMRLGHVMLIASVVLGLLFSQGSTEIVRAFLTTVVSWETIELALIMIVIQGLENILRNQGLLRKMVDSLTGVISDYRVVMPILAGFIGFLPSAGGAMFSAPLVEEVSIDHPVSPERKSFINFYYRHIWECLLPVYPAVVLASRVAEAPINRMLAVLFPIALLMIIFGTPYLFYKLSPAIAKPESSGAGQNRTLKLKEFFASTLPILIILFMVLALKIDVLPSLLVVVAGLIIRYRYGKQTITEIAQKAFSLDIIMLVVGVMIFKNMLVKTGVVESLPPVLLGFGIPTPLVIFLLPFIVGVLTGMSTAFIAITFPIILGLIDHGELWPIAFAYASGFAGMMVTPMHLCLALTINFYKAKLGRVLVMLAVPMLSIVAVMYVITFMF
jgi:integral membrane protein (TIGR00529 family)